jgi:3-hydroxyisobutyrate dehydrogenase-like beta-hydroxyacid dehydrogenase
MGSALGASWRAGGAEVLTCVAGRSARTREAVERAGLTTVESRKDVMQADVVVSVVPPGEASQVAHDIADWATYFGALPLVVDLNAVAPTTVERIAGVLGDARLFLVDGSISGMPPGPDRRPTRVYLSGGHAGGVAAIASPWTQVTVLDGPVGRASALKMCTASMYKGTNALVMHAMLTAHAHGVLDEFLADVARVWPDRVPTWHLDVALAATKSARFVDEMREIARTQGDVGLPGELFDGVAAAFAQAATTRLGQMAPEKLESTASARDVLAALGPAAGEGREEEARS